MRSSWGSTFLFVVLYLLLLSPSSHADHCWGQGLKTITASNENPSGFITDHDEPGNYTDTSQICQWVIKSTIPNSKITLRFTKFDLLELPSQRQNDYVEFKDGNSTISPELIWFTGSDHTPVVETSGPAVFIQFYIAPNHTGKSAGGFRLEYHAGICPTRQGYTCNRRGFCWDNLCQCDPGFWGPDCAETRCENNCGNDKKPPYGQCEKSYCKCKDGYYGGDCLSPFCDPVNYMKATSGDIKDHHRELNDGRDGYRHNTNCSWIIQSDDPSEHIILTFKELDIEPDYDFVTVYEGNIRDPSKIMGKITGTQIPNRFTTVGPSMLITFESDEGVSNVGFVAHYEIKLSNSKIPIGYFVVTALVFFVLGAFAGVGGFLFFKKWQQRSNELEYSKVPLQAEDLADLSEEET